MEINEKAESAAPSVLTFVKNNLEEVLLWTMFLATGLAYSLYTLEQFETLKFGIAYLLGGAVLVVGGIKIYKNQISLAGSAFVRPALWLAGFFWFWLSVGVLASTDRLNSFFGFYYRFSNSWMFLSLWLALFVFLLVWASPSLLKRLLFACGVVAGAVALWGILQSFGIGYAEPGNTSFLRAPSFLGNPNYSAMYVVSLLPVICGFILTASKRLTRLLSVFFGVGVVIMCLTVFSRGAFLALAVSCALTLLLALLFLPAKRNMVLKISAGLLFVTLSTVLLFSSALKPMLRSASLADKNVETRLFVWDLAREAVEGRPWLGVGLGNFQTWYEQGRGKNFASESSLFDDAHNLPLQLAATGGLPLVGAFIGLCLLTISAAWLRLRRLADVWDLSLLSACCAFLVAAAFTPVSVTNYLFFALLLAAMVKGVSPELSTAKPISKAPGLIFVAAGLVFAVWGLLFSSGEVLLFSGMKSYWQGNYKDSLGKLNIAYRLNPTNQLSTLFLAAASIKDENNLAKFEFYRQQNLRYHALTSETYMQQAQLYMIAYQKNRKKEYSDNVKYSLIQSLGYNPYSHVARYYLGEYYFLSSNFKSSQKMMESILIMNGEYFDAWRALAKIYQINRQSSAMLFALQKAFTLRPSRDFYDAIKALSEGTAPEKVILEIPQKLGEL